jgi:hypothetical protein
MPSGGNPSPLSQAVVLTLIHRVSRLKLHYSRKNGTDDATHSFLLPLLSSRRSMSRSKLDFGGSNEQHTLSRPRQVPSLLPPHHRVLTLSHYRTPSSHHT